MFSIETQTIMGTTIAVLVALAVAAPSAPGFIGVYQTGCIAGFAIFGLNKELAIAYSLVTHITQYIGIVSYGVYLLFKYQMKLGEMVQLREGLQPV